MTNKNEASQANKLDLQQWLPEVCSIAYQAGRVIAKIYRQQDDVAVETKSDGSPVTEADLAADQLICKALQALTPNIPLVTEESVAKVPYETRQAWSTYWLVDPLDGTKEFIAKTGEYSVNIALIHNHNPVLGLVYGPELGDLYFAYNGEDISQPSRVGKLANLWPEDEVRNWPEELAHAIPIQVAPSPDVGFQKEGVFRVAVSRRHGGALQHFLAQLGHSQMVRMGSALKACLVAEGKADIYPRFGPTSLWDTAASQCIVEAAGGAVLNAAGHSIEYVQTESLLNPFFIAVSHKDYNWPAFPEVL